MFLRVSVIATIVAALCAPATAQQLACAKRAEVLKHLSAKYTEAPVALGLANNGGVLEVLSTKSGSSWTIIITMPSGPTCMVAAGENWEKIPHVARVGKQGA